MPGVRIASPGPTSHSLSDPKARPVDIEMLRYTLRLAERLEDGVHGAGVDALILMAEARMLGAIRRHLSAATKRHIQASLNTPVPDWDEASLADKLRSLLTEKRSAQGHADFF